MALTSLILDTLFPDVCLACLRPSDDSFQFSVACPPCLATVILPDTLHCAVCAIPTFIPPTCHPYRAAITHVSTTHDRVMRHLTHGLLYDGVTRTADPIAGLMTSSLISLGIPLHRTMITSIPDLPTTVRERGYDADYLVAMACAQYLQLPLVPHLLSTRVYGGIPVYGIDTPGDGASAHLLLVLTITSVAPSSRDRITDLLRSACPHADIVFLSAVG